MPLVRISLRGGTTPAFRKSVGDSIHRAMVETIKIPEADKFQLITEHDQDGLVYDPGYLGIARSDGVLFVQITLSAGRPLEVRKALFKGIADHLAADAGVRPEDIFVSLVEIQKENWSFGNGIAQYAT